MVSPPEIKVAVMCHPALPQTAVTPDTSVVVLTVVVFLMTAMLR